MRVLGAILAGGRSRRFGSDKAQIEIDGERLLDRVHQALKPQVAKAILCGREEPGFACIEDRPRPDLGPLGGLNAALHYAAANGFGAVLSTGCDVPNLPPDVLEQLGRGPAFVQSQPVIGLWPVSLADMCEERLTNGQRSMFGFAEAASATPIVPREAMLNINRPEDAAKLAASSGNQ